MRCNPTVIGSLDLHDDGLPISCRRNFQASIERDTDPTRLSPDNVTMLIAVLCVDNQVE
jgi:hypothetical protein